MNTTNKIHSVFLSTHCHSYVHVVLNMLHYVVITDELDSLKRIDSESFKHSK